MGVMDDDLEDYGDEADSQYENEPNADNQMGYGSQVDDDEDIGVDDGEDDDDEGWNQMQQQSDKDKLFGYKNIFKIQW